MKLNDIIINKNKSVHEKRVEANYLILKISKDEVLQKIFRLSDVNDLYNYIQIVKKNLIVLNDDDIFKVIKSFWQSIINVSGRSEDELCNNFSITKKIPLKIIFSTWSEILEHSENQYPKHTLFEKEYFHKAANFLCSPNKDDIHTLAAYVQETDQGNNYSSLEFWETKSPSKEIKSNNEKKISDFTSTDKQGRLINLIKFGLRCKEVDKSFVLNDVRPAINETYEIYHYEFKDINPRIELISIYKHLVVCFFEKGFYELSKTNNSFDFNECLMVNWINFRPNRHRWTPLGFQDNMVGFKPQKGKTSGKENKREDRKNVDVDTYKYKHELKDLELVIFSFHKNKNNNHSYKNTNLELPFKYKN